MSIWIKENTVPEEVGEYNSATKTLVVNKNLKIYEGYSFTKDVKAIVPGNPTLTISFVGKNIKLGQDLGTKDKQWAGVTV